MSAASARHAGTRAESRAMGTRPSLWVAIDTRSRVDMLRAPQAVHRGW